MMFDGQGGGRGRKGPRLRRDRATIMRRRNGPRGACFEPGSLKAPALNDDVATWRSIFR
jgi:hypothetical protein